MRSLRVTRASRARTGGVKVRFGPEAVAALASIEEADVVVNALKRAPPVLRASSSRRSPLARCLRLRIKKAWSWAAILIMPMAAKVDAARRAAGVAPATGPAGALMPRSIPSMAQFTNAFSASVLKRCHAWWVTASGGPFRGRTRDELRDMTAAQALKHPTWNMGAKITIDSSTLMNKGLEVIEAHHLFDMPYDRIKVVVQPQSAIHSMVEYSDGSVKAHLGTTDMRIPIQFALSYPDRWDAPVEPLDFTQLGKLEFYPVDEDTFRCFKLAKYAGNTGGTLPCVMNAANEVAAAAFLRNACGYLDIDGCVGAMMEAHEAGQGGGLQKVESLDQLAEIDAWARESFRGMACREGEIRLVGREV